jgi:hypothetical protein
MDKYKARKELHKDHVQSEVIKAIKTTMIGALSSIEEKLGNIWGFKENRPLTEDEQYFAEVYQELRKEILDRGNGQIKAIKAKIDLYELDYVGYQMNLVLPTRRKENDEETRF